MPESVEVETKELHEAVQEIHEEHERHEKEEKEGHWTRYIALTTAFLAVFAAIGALQAGKLVNDGMIQQIKASDTWAEYQADRLKTHLYTVEVNSLVDSNPTITYRTGAEPQIGKAVRSLPAADRIKQYQDEIDRESTKDDKLSKEATSFEAESAADMAHHGRFASSVALIQVAIALSAIAALTKIKSVWFGSIAIGMAGIALFAIGCLAR